MAVEPLSPEWWLERLQGKLNARAPYIRQSDAWYAGEHPAPLGYEKGRDVLSRLLELCSANYLAIAVDSALERLQTTGFKVAGEVSQELSDVWQSNNLDLGSAMVYTEKMAVSQGLMLVSPELNASGLPTVTPEHPLQAIVESRPGSMTIRDAGLKIFHDDRLGVMVATLYLPDSVTTFMADGHAQPVTPFRMGPGPRWERQGSMSGPNPLGEVPLVDFRNRPRMLKHPVAEFEPAVGIQKRINKTLLDRMVMQEFSAFKQKWATGIDVPEDENGQPVEPFRSAIDRLFVSEHADAKFGELSGDDISSLQSAIADDAKMMASIVPTPSHYLHSDGDNVSAEQAKVSESGLVARVRRQMREIDEPLETAMRLALRAAGLSVPRPESMETVWRDPETRTDAELTDSLMKAKALDIPREVLWERFGATPQQVAAWPGLLAAQAASAGLGDVAALFAPKPTPPAA